MPSTAAATTGTWVKPVTTRRHHLSSTNSSNLATNQLGFSPLFLLHLNFLQQKTHSQKINPKHTHLHSPSPLSYPNPQTHPFLSAAFLIFINLPFTPSTTSNPKDNKTQTSSKSSKLVPQQWNFLQRAAAMALDAMGRALCYQKSSNTHFPKQLTQKSKSPETSLPFQSTRSNTLCQSPEKSRPQSKASTSATAPTHFTSRSPDTTSSTAMAWSTPCNSKMAPPATPAGSPKRTVLARSATSGVPVPKSHWRAPRPLWHRPPPPLLRARHVRPRGSHPRHRRRQRRPRLLQRSPARHVGRRLAVSR
ncbi:9-cis-epoxycarotenoid dioxygenase NCED1 chloroplastic [Prunus yedoensis var. nudiflora]|uniref:9-cis-epoxycarotenoid dioxygenase NCED1 chloroplastic n=1 Tax=Prunus yedoensis var. nudiflora TaxID=2094558 RepID=A0A314UDT4_PRUYE|nr:9-cis-epoxycarotenoid dioxygenase NCED1 chloroplastic [Prunus yedoensis var. nudiflora]